MSVAVSTTTNITNRYRASVQIDEATTTAYELVYATRPSDVADFVDWMRRNALKVIAYDVETGGLNVFQDGLATLQIGNPICGEPRAYVFCVRTLGREALQPVLDVLADPGVMKLGQNIKFECRWTEHYLGTRLRNVACTQVAELLLRAGLIEAGRTGSGDGEGDGSSRKVYAEASMAALCRRHLGIEIDKDHHVRTSFYKTPPGTLNMHQLTYAALDVIYPFYIAREQKVELTARALVSIARLEWELVPILAHAELWGIPIDADRWTALWQEAVVEAAKAKRAVDELFRGTSAQDDLFPGQRPTGDGGKPLNYNSSHQVCNAIARYCHKAGWPIEIVTSKYKADKLKAEYGAEYLAWRREKDPTFPVDKIPDHVVPEEQYCLLVSKEKKVLKLAMLRGQLPRELVTALLTWSVWEKRTKMNKFLVDNYHEDGTIKTEFHQAIVDTGRLSTTPNIQNIDKAPQYRACFRPRPGYKFVQFDYSQQEPRTTAQVTRDPTYVTTFVGGDGDIYCSMGETMDGSRPDRDSPDYKAWRQKFKGIVLAKAYRSGKAKLRDQLTLNLEKLILAGDVEPPSKEWVAELNKTFQERCPDVVRFQAECTRVADHTTSDRKIWDKYVRGPVTFVESLCGRKRFFTADDETYTQPCNAPIQGLGASMMKAAAVLVEREILAQGFDAHVANLVHDEGVWEVCEDQAERFAPVVKAKMEEAGRYYLPDIPITAEPPAGTNGVVDCWTKDD
jgi:DNA polymerase I-like protein with 3'-5' exonuclease and polymerase domains